MQSISLPDVTALLDWTGTFVFALSGALLAVRKKFDLFGVLFLSIVVAVAGGIFRDVLIGVNPPVAVTEIHYVLIAVGGGLLTFCRYPKVASLHRKILLFDAVGLGLFAVMGTQKAIDHGVHPLMAALLGMLTGIGGGLARDILAGDTPFVLHRELYAVAAFSGSALVSIGDEIGISSGCSMLSGATICIFLRFMAIYRGWRVPSARVNLDKDG